MGTEPVDPRQQEALREAEEGLRLAAGYFQAIEEQLRPLLDHPDTPNEFKLSAYGTAMETAANIAMHQRNNIERAGFGVASVKVLTMPSDATGENALAWLSGLRGDQRRS